MDAPMIHYAQVTVRPNVGTATVALFDNPEQLSMYLDMLVLSDIEGQALVVFHTHPYGDVCGCDDDNGDFMADLLAHLAGIDVLPDAEPTGIDVLPDAEPPTVRERPEHRACRSRTPEEEEGVRAAMIRRGLLPPDGKE